MDGVHHGTGSTLGMQTACPRPHAGDGQTIQASQQGATHGGPCGQIGWLCRL